MSIFTTLARFHIVKIAIRLCSRSLTEKVLMNNFPAHVPMLALCLCAISSPSMADAPPMQDCKAEPYEIGANYTQGPGCLLSWVDNNQLQTVVWNQVEQDFQEASLHQDAMELPVLTSRYWPELVDVDQDGWLDMVTFEWVGQVNGAFVIFFYDPVTEEFIQADSLYGHTLERDKVGYIVTTSRSGYGWIYRIYTLTNRELNFLFEVEPTGMGQSGDQFGRYCDVSLGYEQPLQFDDIIASGQVPDAETFFATYCDLEPDFASSGRTEPLHEMLGETDRVPFDTAFYCVLDGGTKAVTITHTSHSMLYTYGPVGGEVELELSRPHNLVRTRPDVAIDDIRSGDITFANGAYEYTVYKNGELSENGNNSASTDAFASGLVVYKGGDSTAPIFESTCIPGRSIDLIFQPENR